MDIEGAEWLAIKGAGDALKSWGHRLSILMELHPDQIKRYRGTAKELQGLLEQAGFAVWSLESNKLVAVSHLSRFWWATNEEEIARMDQFGLSF
jgi:hypothetical protein